MLIENSESLKKYVVKLQTASSNPYSPNPNTIFCFYFSITAREYNHSFAQTCLLLRIVSQNSDVTHGPLVKKVNQYNSYLYIYSFYSKLCPAYYAKCILPIK